MELQIRKLNSTDYDNILVGWWKDWNWDAPPKDFLPDDSEGGIIVFDGDTPICAGFLYATNSKASWIDWIISNKDYRKKPQRKQALVLLIETLTNISKNAGNKYGYALIKHKGLISTYESLGYVKGDSYTAEMLKKF
jgi:hypothetical protein